MIFNPSLNKKVAIFPYTSMVRLAESNPGYLPFLNYPYEKIEYPYFDYISESFIGEIEEQSSDESNYFFGYCANLKVNEIVYYKDIDTFTYSNFFSAPANDALKTEGSITIPAVLPFIEGTQQSKFQEAVWRIGAFPFVPFMIYTDITPLNIGGPVFASKWSISVSEGSPINVSMSFTGGTSVRPPLPGTIDSGDFPFQEGYVAGISTSQADKSSWRHNSFYDCLFGVSFVEDVPIYESAVSSTIWYQNQNEIQISKMTLDIEQDIKLIYTSNDGDLKNISDGPKYAALKKRSVRGSIELKSSTNLSIIYSNPGAKIQQLIMFFGGPFYFPMRNVTINFFDSNLDASSKTWTNNISFTAYTSFGSSNQDSDAQLLPGAKWHNYNPFSLDPLTLSSEILGTLKTDEI